MQTKIFRSLNWQALKIHALNIGSEEFKTCKLLELHIPKRLRLNSHETEDNLRKNFILYYFCFQKFTTNCSRSTVQGNKELNSYFFLLFSGLTSLSSILIEWNWKTTNTQILSHPLSCFIDSKWHKSGKKF